MVKKAEKLEEIIEEKRTLKKKIVHDLKIINNDTTNTKITIDLLVTETGEVNKVLKDVENEVK